MSEETTTILDMDKRNYERAVELLKKFMYKHELIKINFDDEFGPIGLEVRQFLNEIGEI